MTTMIQILKPQLQQIKKRKKGRKAKPKAVKVNRRVELFYTRQLLEIFKYCQEQTKDFVLPTVGQNIGDSWVTDLFTALREKMVKYTMEVSVSLATKVVIDTSKEVDKQIASHTKTILGVDLTPFFRGADIQDEIDTQIAANVSLIKSIPSQYTDKLEALVMNALQTGQTNEDLAQEIKKLGHSTDYRARLIASDQMGKINGQINKARQISRVLKLMYGSQQKMSVYEQIIGLKMVKHSVGMNHLQAVIQVSRFDAGARRCRIMRIF